MNKDKELEKLVMLKRDFDSCQLPNWSDTMTKRTLDNIIEAIHLGHISFKEVYSFIDENFGTGDFAWGCTQYIRNRI